MLSVNGSAVYTITLIYAFSWVCLQVQGLLVLRGRPAPQPG
jgi:hypothetical protein